MTYLPTYTLILIWPPPTLHVSVVSFVACDMDDARLFAQIHRKRVEHWDLWHLFEARASVTVVHDTRK